MKKANHIVIVCLTILFILPSCSVNNQAHRSGFRSGDVAELHNGHSGNYKNCSRCMDMLGAAEEQPEVASIPESGSNMKEPAGMYREASASVAPESSVLVEEHEVQSLTETEKISASTSEPDQADVFDNSGGLFESTIEAMIASAAADNAGGMSDQPDGDKSWVVAILLWLFLGGLGIHRFYLGYVGMGILYLFTGALCGIGWIIDGIMLLTGSLQPKYGSYNDR